MSSTPEAKKPLVVDPVRRQILDLAIDMVCDAVEKAGPLGFLFGARDQGHALFAEFDRKLHEGRTHEEYCALLRQGIPVDFIRVAFEALTLVGAFKSEICRNGPRYTLPEVAHLRDIAELEAALAKLKAAGA